MLPILEAVRTWRPYLLGRKFYIHTDQRNLKFLLEQRVATPEQQKWVAKLLGYDYEILYKPDIENKAADALSRVSSSPCLHRLSMPTASIWDSLKKEVTSNPYLISIVETARDKPGAPYTERNGLAYFKNRAVVPPDSAIIELLLKEFHDSHLGGHSGTLRTYK